MFKFDTKYWAIILGGSSGFGLATAQKLSKHGMNLCIVHLDRKKAMPAIQDQFEAIRGNGVRVLTLNVNALFPEGRAKILDVLQQSIGEGESVKLLLHSIAYGNLKFLAPPPSLEKEDRKEVMMSLAYELGINLEELQQATDKLFDMGFARLSSLANTTTEYSGKSLLEADDFALTIDSMGTSLASWVKAVFERNLFAPDARVLSLTSEGNEIAWPGYAAVSAAKATLEAISRSIAVEYAPFGIRANVIQAGITSSPAARKIPGYNHLAASAKMRNPYNRLTQAEDIANFIFLMCQDEAAWLNGALIRVDGGEHIGSLK